MQPEGLKYSTTHEWARLEDGTAVVGITDHAQSELGDIVYVELPQVGAKLSQGDMFGTVESVKTVSDLMSPVSGEVVRVNDALPDAPEMVNDSPYEQGWMIAVKLDNPSELDGLMSAGQYEAFIQEH